MRGSLEVSTDTVKALVIIDMSIIRDTVGSSLHVSLSDCLYILSSSIHRISALAKLQAVFTELTQMSESDTMDDTSDRGGKWIWRSSTHAVRTRNWSDPQEHHR